jgi:pyruvate,water dikinase
VAFTAHPVTGEWEQAIVTAVAGLGDPLVSGETTGEEWVVADGAATVTRPGPTVNRVLTAAQAGAGRTPGITGGPRDRGAASSASDGNGSR